MSDTPPSQGFGAVLASGASAQAVGGAIAIIFLYNQQLARQGAPVTPDYIVQAYTLIFSTALANAAMIGHLLVRKYFPT